MAEKLRGLYSILATPFDSQGRIDEESLRSLVNFELKAGVNGITILGILGEVLRLSDSERLEVTKTVINEVSGQVPVVSGTGATGTDLAIMYSKEAEELGANAVMVAPPRLMKPNDDALVRYYSAISEQINIPIVVQDEPITYPVYMSPPLIARLSEIDGVKYLKLEDPPTPMKISQIRGLVGEKLGIFGGLGGLYAYEELCRGAIGIMTGFAYPEILVGVCNAFSHGNFDVASQLFYRALPLIRYEAQPVVSLAIRKEIFKKRGLIKHATLRGPATNLDAKSLKEIDELIAATKIDELIAESRKIVKNYKRLEPEKS